jgi:cytoskeletal protein CcmA (bactofilin family)
MVYCAFKALIGTLSICVISSGAFLHAECSIDTIIVNGRVEHAPTKGIVKVQLIYPKGKIGESGDVTVEDGSSRIPILFFTQSRAPFLNGSIPPDKCARKPKTIIVSLIANDQEYDRISLDMTKDFKKIELSAYTLRSEILLQGHEGTNP